MRFDELCPAARRTRSSADAALCTWNKIPARLRQERAFASDEQGPNQSRRPHRLIRGHRVHARSSPLGSALQRPLLRRAHVACVVQGPYRFHRLPTQLSRVQGEAHRSTPARRAKYVAFKIRRVHGAPTSLLARLGIRRLTVEHRETCAGSSRTLVHGESYDTVPWPMPGGADGLAAASARGASEPSGLAERKPPTFAWRLDSYRRASCSYGRAAGRRPKGPV